MSFLNKVILTLIYLFYLVASSVVTSKLFNVNFLAILVLINLITVVIAKMLLRFMDKYFHIVR